MTDLVSTAPYMFAGLYNLANTAAQSQPTPVYVATFELEQYEPAQYIILTGIERHVFELETLGPFRSAVESYEICGYATVFVGDSPDALNPTVALKTMFATYALFQSCVMTPAVTYTNAPAWNVTSEYFADGAVTYVYPTRAVYTSGPGEMGGGSAGWFGRVDFGYEIHAFITPM